MIKIESAGMKEMLNKKALVEKVPILVYVLACNF